MILKPNYTHLLRFNKRNRIAKLAEKMFHLFWDLILDRNPKYCFLCGKFITPSERSQENIKQPYKNSELCHDSCWKLFVKMDHVTKRISDDSELICLVDKGENKVGKVCRQRVQNKWNEVYAHIVHHEVKVTELQFPFEYYISLLQLKNEQKNCHFRFPHNLSVF